MLPVFKELKRGRGSVLEVLLVPEVGVVFKILYYYKLNELNNRFADNRGMMLKKYIRLF